MILTSEQILTIEQKLSYAVKYQETYDELYDHVISTIENLDGVYTDVTLDGVIESGFGGYNNLKAIERNSAKIAGKAMQIRHWQNINCFFNWPTVLLTTIITIIGYYICIDSLNRKHLLQFTTTCAALPLLYLAFKMMLNKYKAWYLNDYKKPSIKDSYIFMAAILSNSIINVLTFVANRTVIMNGAISLLIFVCYVIYVMSFFKLYREAYRLNFAR